MNKTWQERFDEEFKIFEQVSADEADGMFATEEDRERVKDFIAQILEEEIANTTTTSIQPETILQTFTRFISKSPLTQKYDVMESDNILVIKRK